ncbi:MAG: hypothetical protein GX294_08470 [Candidatus Cloacimonetes bacterium]|nr:hypothetical protein [Candidatus Cloacimonadota bacterium]
MKKLIFILLGVLAFGTLLHADSMYGAFKVVTSPKGADVTLYDPDLYLAQTPTPVYPVIMDEYMDIQEGIPGRAIMLMITKKGYLPIKEEIYVPFTHESESEAVESPSVFRFEMERDVKNKYWQVSVYYGYRYRHPKPRHHHHFHPWYPPYYYTGWTPPPPPPPPSNPRPRPPVIHQGDVTAGSTQKPPIGSANDPVKPDKTKNPPPNPPKYEQKTTPTKAPSSPVVVPSSNRTETRQATSPPTKAAQPQVTKPAAPAQPVEKPKAQPPVKATKEDQSKTEKPAEPQKDQKSKAATKSK